MILGDMLPRYARFDHADHALTDAVVSCDDALRSFIASYASNNGGGEFRGASSLQGSVDHIVGMSTEEQMTWVYASRSIASVQHLHSSRDWSDVDLVAGPLCGGHVFDTCDPDFSVSVRIDVAGKIDAATRPLPAAQAQALFQGRAAWDMDSLSHDDAVSSLSVRVGAGVASAVPPAHYRSCARLS